MNFAEAAKSGYPIRRAGWEQWILYNKDNHLYEWENGDPIGPDMRPEWFQNEDWEVDWPDVVITRQRYWNAVAQVMKENSGMFMGHPGHFEIQKFLHALADKLGV